MGSCEHAIFPQINIGFFPMDNAFLDALKRRRTQYSLGRNLPVSHEAVAALIREAIKHSPSSFNSQTSRALILFGEQSVKVWDIAKDTLRKIVPAEAFVNTEKKLNSFAAGAGTVLFFEDQDAVKALQEKFALYADNFPVWSEQAGGMAQLSVWSTLANAGIGASLQHYNPLIDEAVAKEWNLPASWKLRAQMPFGSNEAAFGDKPFMDDAERFRVHH
jgi:predicted oxidoreductase (fatty acid repression mutant protein)